MYVVPTCSSAIRACKVSLKSCCRCGTGKLVYMLMSCNVSLVKLVGLLEQMDSLHTGFALMTLVRWYDRLCLMVCQIFLRELFDQ